MTNFYFQNKDTILANISIDKNRIILHSYSKVLDKLYYNFEDWIHNRIEVSNRLNIYDMCKIAGMIILDSIILNIDRHGSNYGLLFNTNNLQYIGMTPIFDNDCSLGSFDEQALKFINKEIYSKLKKLDLTKFKFNFYNIRGLSENRKEFINYLVNRRISEIVALTEKTYNIK